MFQNENEQALDEEPHGDREKRKIGVIKLGVSNGIINFVFGVSIYLFIYTFIESLGLS